MNNMNGKNKKFNSDNGKIVNCDDGKKKKRKNIEKDVKNNVKKKEEKRELFEIDSEHFNNLIIKARKKYSNVLIKDSTCDDEGIILAYLIKFGKKKYKCENSGCNVKNSWNKKPIYLFVKRLNSKNNDLRISNLKIMCPNCYFQDIRNNKMINTLKKTLYKECKICGWNGMKNLSEDKQITGICMICTKKLGKKDNYKSSYIDSYKTVKTDNIITYKKSELTEDGYIKPLKTDKNGLIMYDTIMNDDDIYIAKDEDGNIISDNKIYKEINEYGNINNSNDNNIDDNNIDDNTFDKYKSNKKSSYQFNSLKKRELSNDVDNIFNIPMMKRDIKKLVSSIVNEVDKNDVPFNDEISCIDGKPMKHKKFNRQK